MSAGLALGVNIDHVATLRQARRGRYPDPVHAALSAESAGADSITLHLREDRRHIQDQDVRALRPLLQTRMNLEMAVTDEMLAIAVSVLPADCCLVPERRAELTTEGGLDVLAQPQRLRAAVAELTRAGVRVALFIDPERAQIEGAARAGAPVVELHTGAYAQASGAAAATELERLHAATRLAASLGLDGARRPWTQLSQRAAGGGDRRDHRAQHRPRAHRPRAVRRPAGGGARDEGADGGGTRVIFGIGVDVLESARVARTLERFGTRFIERLLMPEEQAQLVLTARRERFLAMRFAAKEAIVKAMGTGFAHGVWIRDVGVVQNAWGKPEVVFSARGERVRRALGVGEGHVTLSDERGLVVAVAVLMRAP